MNEDKRCDEGRRTFCKAAIGGMSVLSAAMVGYPVISFLAQPEAVGANKPLEIPLERVAAGQAEYVDFRGQQLIVLGTGEKPRMFSASCPHLGCNVLWDSGEQKFRCPCHGAVFDAQGQVVKGPVSSPLTKVNFEVKNGKIVVG